MTHEPVRNRLDISTRGAHRVVEVSLIHRPRVVAAESLIVVAVLGIQLLQSIARRRTLRTITDHLKDATLRVARVERDTGVGLHDARVPDAVVGGADAHVAAGFLHDDAQDDARVDAGFGRDSLDGGLDVGDFAGAVVEGHEGGVLRPEGVEVGPVAWVREPGGRAAVVDVAPAHAAGSGAAAARGGGGSSGAGEVDDLADLEAAGVYAGVGGFEGADGGAVGLGDGPEGVAGFDSVRHFVVGLGLGFGFWVWVFGCWVLWFGVFWDLGMLDVFVDVHCEYVGNEKGEILQVLIFFTLDPYQAEMEA